MRIFGFVALVIGISAPVLAGSFGAQVVSYNAGTEPASRWYGDDAWNEVETVLLTDPSAALGKPTGFIVEPYMTTPGTIVSPFSPAANPDQIVSIGEGGSLTLRLENYAIAGAGVEIGLFANVGVYTYGGASGTLGVDGVTVEVSYDTSEWTSLGPITADIPTNVWADASDPYLTSTDGLTEADFSKPFTGEIADLLGKTYAEIKTSFDGSAGGYWIDLSPAGLTEVGYIRFSVADDGDAGKNMNFELDAVSVASGHIGAVTTPEPCSLGLLAMVGTCLLRRRGK